jgi:hypothetical protein
VNDVTSTEIIPAPYLEKDVTMVPLRWIAEGLGAAIAWDEVTNGIVVATPTAKAEFWIGQTEITINGKMVQSPSAVVIKQEITYVPLRIMADAFQQQIYYQNGLIILSNEAFEPPHEFLTQSMEQLKEGFPYAVYQGEKLIEWFGQTNSAITYAKQWSHASVRDLSGSWIWDNYLPYLIYQKDYFICQKI